MILSLVARNSLTDSLLACFLECQYTCLSIVLGLQVQDTNVKIRYSVHNQLAAWTQNISANPCGYRRLLIFPVTPTTNTRGSWSSGCTWPFCTRSAVFLKWSHTQNTFRRCSILWQLRSNNNPGELCMVILTDIHTLVYLWGYGQAL